MKTIGFVVATKDRPDDLRRLLLSLAGQTHRPDLTVVVDASAAPVSYVVEEFGDQIPLRYLHHQPPSASAQRNAGIEVVPPDTELIGFLDDDAVLETDALEKMLAFWTDATADAGGAAFNMVNHPVQAMGRLKRWSIVKALGVYSDEPGRVTTSGWQTMIGFVSRDTETDWLSSGAVVWRSQLVRACHFDEFYSGYSYLEDLDFSFTLRQSRWRLWVVADARYGHYPSPVRHANGCDFGRTEIRNRLYFVRKHGLSGPCCWLGIAGRLAITLGNALLHFDRDSTCRAFGNLAEIGRLLLA